MSDRCAIVTGGAGFIGSHVVDALLADDWRVVVVDDLSTGDARSRGDARRRSRSWTSPIEPHSTRVVDEAQPAAIFHLAAQSSVTRSVADPEQDCEINVRGTLNVLDAATRHRAPVVFTSTGGALYGDARRCPRQRTHHPLRSHPTVLRSGQPRRT